MKKEKNKKVYLCHSNGIETFFLLAAPSHWNRFLWKYDSKGLFRSKRFERRKNEEWFAPSVWWEIEIFFEKMGHARSLFHLFSSFQTIITSPDLFFI